MIGPEFTSGVDMWRQARPVFDGPQNNQQRADFMGQLSTLQEELDTGDFDVRITGSLAAAAYLDDDARRLNFNRPGAVTDDQRYPDLDIIAPREQLDDLRSIRERQLRAEVPLKLGLAVSTMFVDYRPHEEQSLLTYRTVETAIPSLVFARRDQELIRGLALPTVDPRTLIHTLTISNNKMRDKDVITAQSLQTAIDSGEIISTLDESQLDGFRDYAAQRREQHRLAMAFDRIPGKVLRAMPPQMRARVMKLALPVASKLGMR